VHIIGERDGSVATEATGKHVARSAPVTFRVRHFVLLQSYHIEVRMQTKPIKK
jgi:hypothetical protein